MSTQIIKVATFQEKINSAFVNLTELDSSLYPAVTTVQITQPEFNTAAPALSTYFIYDQWALRTKAV